MYAALEVHALTGEERRQGLPRKNLREQLEVADDASVVSERGAGEVGPELGGAREMEPEVRRRSGNV